MRRPSALASAALLAAAPAPSAGAQTAAPPAPRFGVLAGLNSATITGENFFGEDVSVSQGRRNGVVGGVYVALPFGAPGLAFRPELLYAHKGTRYGATFPLPPANGAARTADARADIRLSYAELPLLLEYTVPTRGGVRPQLFAGPALAVRLTCRAELRVTGGLSTAGETDCEGLGDLLGEDTPDLHRFDVGGVVGGAVAFDLGGRALTVGVRYTHGFVELAPDSDARNRAVGVHGSVELPLARRPR